MKVRPLRGHAIFISVIVFEIYVIQVHNIISHTSRKVIDFCSNHLRKKSSRLLKKSKRNLLKV